MPRGKLNWNFADVKKFAELNGYIEEPPSRDSHYIFRHPTDKTAFIEIQYHAKAAIRPKTLESCIRKSGIKQKEWLHFSKDKKVYEKWLKKKKRGKFKE